MDLVQEFDKLLGDFVAPKKGSNTLQEFYLYRHKPSHFAKEVLQVATLTDEQEEILEEFGEKQHARVAVPSANAMGKTFIAALLTTWWVFCLSNDSVALTTAPTFRQVAQLLWKEINKFFLRYAFPFPAKCQQTKLTVGPKQYGFGFASDNPDAYQGFHAENLLFIVDEANGFPETLRDAVESCVAGQKTGILLIGNPMNPEGWFYDACTMPENLGYKVVHMDAYNHPNVTNPHIVIPGAVTPGKIDEWKSNYGEDSDIFRSRVRGVFPDPNKQTNIVVPLPKIELAEFCPVPESPRAFNILSVDVARFGPDNTVLLGVNVYQLKNEQFFYETHLHEQHNSTDATEVLALIHQAAQSDEYDMIIIDEIGIGGAISDLIAYMVDFPIPVIQSFNGQNQAHDVQKRQVFLNCKAEGYYDTRKAFDEKRVRVSRHPAWKAQLPKIKFEFALRGAGRIKAVHPEYDKKQSRKISPDDAYTLMMAVWAGEHLIMYIDTMSTTQTQTFIVVSGG